MTQQSMPPAAQPGTPEANRSRSELRTQAGKLSLDIHARGSAWQLRAHFNKCCNANECPHLAGLTAEPNYSATVILAQ